MIWALLACTPAIAPVEAVEIPQISAPRLLRRASLDLRGTLPSTAELDSAEAQPEGIQATIEQWLLEPAFQERLVLMLGEQWHTRVEAFPIEAWDYDLEDQEYAFERAVGEEPLRLAAHVVTTGQPWSEVVQADYTLANPMLQEIWGLEALESGSGWVRAQYQDDRPHAGVLSTNGLWWRYNTDVSNMNRRRVAAISRLLVCHDLLSRPVSLGESASEDVENAVQTDPACMTCHAALDPAAAALFGFWTVIEYSEIEHANYHPERELLYDRYLGVEPAWHGVPVSGPESLGQAIAADPRFDTCAVQRFSEALIRRPITREEQVSLGAGYEGVVLDWLPDLLASPQYGAQEVRLLTPQQLDSALLQATGFSWTQDGTPLMDLDSGGLRQLAGGVDGEQVKGPQQVPGLTRTLVIQRLGERAARSVAAQGSIDIAQWHWRLLAERPTDQDMDALEALHSTVLAQSDVQTADAAVLTVLMRDAAFEAY